MPTFTITGEPVEVRAASQLLEAQATVFGDAAAALERLTTEGWTGRAADRFRDVLRTEPRRWSDAADGFSAAAGAYERFATVLEAAQRAAEAARAEYERGERQTALDRAAWERDLARRQDEAMSTWGTAIVPVGFMDFVDTGTAIRAQAVAAYDAAVSQVDAAAASCADQVRAACEAAPDRRNWAESGLAFLGGVVHGAGESLWGLVTLTPLAPISMIEDVWALTTGRLTAEELIARHRLAAEVPGQLMDALRADPWEFGKQMGRALLDLDTWADDPGRALGRLLPDAIATVLTAGTGGAALRGLRLGDDALDAAGDLARLSRSADGPPVPTPTSVALANGAQHTVAYAVDQLDLTRSSRNVIDRFLADPAVFSRHGEAQWTRDDLVRAIVDTPVSDLTPAQRAVIMELNDRLPPPTRDDIVQKVLTPDQARQLLDPEPGADPTRISGSVARAEDVASYSTPQKLGDALRLDYDGGRTFPPDRASDMVIRWRVGDDAPEVSRFRDMGGSGSTDGWGNPYTGNGFTKSPELVPEYRFGEPVRMERGAEMWEVQADGTQRLRAVLGSSGWERVL
ncbi:putative T7SS-secreted protein [Cellulomonas bogoriensis]|nr:hypothetical protein [Cellulomonas bogoriensis]